MRELALVFFAGALSGILVIGGFRRRNGVTKKEKPLARLMAAVLEPTYYWANLYGMDGNPSHAKVMYAIGLVVLLSLLGTFGTAQFASGLGMTWPLVGAIVVVGAYCMGPNSFNRVTHFLKGKFPEATRESAAHPIPHDVSEPRPEQIPDGGLAG